MVISTLKKCSFIYALKQKYLLEQNSTFWKYGKKNINHICTHGTVTHIIDVVIVKMKLIHNTIVLMSWFCFFKLQEHILSQLTITLQCTNVYQ